MSKFFQNLRHFCTETNHPWVQIFYLFIGPFLYIACWASILHWKQIVIGTFWMSVSHTVAFLGFYNYARAWLTDPGVVTKNNEQSYISKYNDYYDKFAFKKDNKCESCQLIK